MATPLHLDITFGCVIKIDFGLDHLRKFVLSKIQIDLNLNMHSEVKTCLVPK